MFFIFNTQYFVCEMLLFDTDESLDRSQQFVDIVVNFGNNITAEEQQQLAGTAQLTVGQHVLAKSSANGGGWCSAVVISTGHR